MEHSDISSLAQFCFKIIESEISDVKTSEIYFEKNKYINIEIEENSIKNSEVGEDIGASVRVINRNGALGFAYSNKLVKPSIE